MEVRASPGENYVVSDRGIWGSGGTADPLLPSYFLNESFPQDYDDKSSVKDSPVVGKLSI